MFFLYLPDNHDLTFWRLNFNKSIKMLNGNQFFFFLKKGRDIYLEVIWITGAKEMSWNQCHAHGRVHFLLLESTSSPRLSSALTIQKMTIAFARVSASPQGNGFPAEHVVPYSSQHVPFCILMNLLTGHAGSVSAHGHSELLYIPAADWPSPDQRWTSKDEQSCSLTCRL